MIKLEWNPEVESLYNNVVLNMPESVRPIISSALYDKTIKRYTERGGIQIKEVDLIVALLEVTPPAFQPTMIDDLKKLGVDYEKYLVLVKGGFQHNIDLDILVSDLKKISNFTGVKCNEKKIWKVINAYKTFFTGSSLSIRTTTLHKDLRDISVRYVELMNPHNPDPYVIAINNDLINPNGHPLHKMLSEIKEKFNVLGYGVDLDVRKGLAKIWSLIAPTSIKNLYSMSNIPKSIVNYTKFFKKFGLTKFSLIALDFLHKSMNIYFMVKEPKTSSLELYKNILENLNFEINSSEVLEKCCDARTIYFTFNWESEVIERICFGMVCPTKENIPVEFHPLMKEFVEKVPFATENHKFIYSIPFTRKNNYFKIENDYNGTMTELLLMSAQAGISF